MSSWDYLLHYLDNWHLHTQETLFNLTEIVKDFSSNECRDGLLVLNAFISNHNDKSAKELFLTLSLDLYSKMNKIRDDTIDEYFQLVEHIVLDHPIQVEWIQKAMTIDKIKTKLFSTFWIEHIQNFDRWFDLFAVAFCDWDVHQMLTKYAIDFCNIRPLVYSIKFKFFKLIPYLTKMTFSNQLENILKILNQLNQNSDEKSFNNFLVNFLRLLSSTENKKMRTDGHRKWMNVFKDVYTDSNSQLHSLISMIRNNENDALEAKVNAFLIDNIRQLPSLKNEDLKKLVLFIIDYLEMSKDESLQISILNMILYAKYRRSINSRIIDYVATMEKELEKQKNKSHLAICICKNILD